MQLIFITIWKGNRARKSLIKIKNHGGPKMLISVNVNLRPPMIEVVYIDYSNFS